MSDDAPSFDITNITIYYSIAATLLLIVEAGVVSLFKRRRPKDHGDGLFVLHHWGKTIRAVVVCVLMTFVALPASVFWIALALGALLAAIEGWGFSDGYEYVICNMLGIGPMVNLTPANTGGIIADVVISCLAMLIGATILGISACLTLTVQWSGTLAPTAGGLARAMLLYIPAMMLVIAVATGACMASIEDWAFSDGFLFMVGVLCGIQDPLTQVAPVSDTGNFFFALCWLFELLVAGGVIGVVGGHPAVMGLLDFIQGLDMRPAEDERAGDEGKHKEPPMTQIPSRLPVESV